MKQASCGLLSSASRLRNGCAPAQMPSVIATLALPLRPPGAAAARPRARNEPGRQPLIALFHCVRVLLPSWMHPFFSKLFKCVVVRPVLFILNNVPFGCLFDWFMFLLGPALIMLATSLVCWCAGPLQLNPCTPRPAANTLSQCREQGCLRRVVLHPAVESELHVSPVVLPCVHGLLHRVFHPVQLFQLCIDESRVSRNSEPAIQASVNTNPPTCLHRPV